MKKRFLLLFLFFTFSVSSAFSGIFSDYDFTFYKTISQSLRVFDKDKIGFDYTGFGFLGKQQRTGMFLRFGFQTPFSMPKDKSDNTDQTQDEPNISQDSDSKPATLITSTTSLTTTGNTVLEDSHEKKQQEISSQEYSFTFIMGPAARVITSERINMYVGIGLRFSQNITRVSNPLLNIENVNFKTQLGIDLDVGGRIDINEKTSVRIGLYATSSLMTFNYLLDLSETNEEQSSNKKTDPYATVFIDILNPSSNAPPINAHAYISMGTHFSSTWKDKYYRYEITSPEIFTGQIIEVTEQV